MTNEVTSVTRERVGRRISISMPERDHARLKAIQDALEATSASEAIRAALRHYAQHLGLEAAKSAKKAKR